MRSYELARAFPFVHIAELADKVTLQVEYGNTVPETRGIVYSSHTIQFTNVDMFSPENHRVRSVDVTPHGLEFTVGVENLNPVGFTVDYIYVSVTIYGDVVRAYELACVYTRATPGKFVFSRARVDVDAGVAVSIRYVNVTVSWVDRGGGGAVERFTAPAFSGLIPLSYLHQFFTRGAELLNSVDPVVSAQQRVVMSYIKPMSSVGTEITFSE